MTFIDSVLLAFPEMDEDEELTLDQIKPYWQILESLEEKGDILSIGICDLDKNLLEELVAFATVIYFRGDFCFIYHFKSVTGDIIYSTCIPVFNAFKNIWH